MDIDFQKILEILINKLDTCTIAILFITTVFLIALIYTVKLKFKSHHEIFKEIARKTRKDKR